MNKSTLHPSDVWLVIAVVTPSSDLPPTYTVLTLNLSLFIQYKGKL